MSEQRTSEEIMAEHHEMLDKQNTAINDATRNIKNKYTPKLRALMAEFAAARKVEIFGASVGGRRPDEYSK